MTQERVSRWQTSELGYQGTDKAVSGEGPAATFTCRNSAKVRLELYAVTKPNCDGQICFSWIVREAGGNRFGVGW